MPRLPGISDPVLRQLEADLRHAPRETLLKDVERIEEVALHIDRSLRYPEDWIVHRVTGYRPSADASRVVDGGALLRDLTALCERLCALASLSHDELEPGRFVRLSELRARWGVSEVTLKRLRRDGLVTRRVLSKRGLPEIWVSQRIAQAFLDRRATPLRSMPRRSRDARTRILREAERYRRCLGWSLHRCAERIAQRHGGSVEGVRQLLIRESAGRAGFRARQRSTTGRRLAMLRLWQRGTEIVSLARLEGRSAVAIRREIHLARAMLLRQWLLDARKHTGAARIETLPAPVDPALLPHEQPPDPSNLRLDDWRRMTPLKRDVEHAQARVFRASLAMAHAITSSLDPLQPRASDIDKAETFLRQADQSRARLVCSQLRLVLETCETRAGVDIAQLPHALARRVLRDALRAACECVEHFDPEHGGRLAGPVALGVDRAATRVLRESGWSSSAAVRRAQPLTLTMLPRPTRWSPWSGWLCAPWFVERALRDGSLGSREVRLLRARYGLEGQTPRTIAQLAAEEGMGIAACARMMHACLRRARCSTGAHGVEYASP